MAYSNPKTAVYRFPAATLSSAAVIGRIMPPEGMQGRVVDVSTIVTTGITVAATTVQIGVTATPNAYSTLTVPVASANSGHNGAVSVQDHVIPADAVVDVYAGGECTAGAGDVLVTIDWY